MPTTRRPSIEVVSWGSHGGYARQERPPLAWSRHLPPGYSAEFAEVEDGVYWHLSLNGVRVNGGLSECYEAAQSRAGWTAWQQYKGEPLPGEERWP